MNLVIQPTIRSNAGSMPACEILVPPGNSHLVIRLARCFRSRPFLLGRYSWQLVLPSFGKTQDVNLVALDKTLGGIILEQVPRKIGGPLFFYEER
jgi:hypothetical protein